MPIFPRYESSTQVAAPNTPLPPTEDLRAKQVEKLGESVAQAGMAGYSVAQRFKYLRDVTDASAAYQKAVKEQEDFIQTLQGENAVDAKAKFNKFLEEKQPGWYQGLSKEAAFNLQHDLFPKNIENTAFAQKIEHRYQVDKTGATIANQELEFQRGINKRTILGDPALSSEYQNIVKHVDAAVASGLYSRKDGEELKTRILKNGAYDMAYRYAHNDPKGFQAEYQDYIASKGEKVSWMNHIPAKELSQLNGEAKNAEWNDISRAHTTFLWKREQQDRADDEAREQMEVFMSTAKDKGLLTEQMVDRYITMRRVTGEKAEWWRAAARNELLEGGHGNPEVMREMTWAVANANAGLTPNAELERLRSRVQSEAIKRNIPRKQAETWMNQLNESLKSENSHDRRETQDAKQILLHAIAPQGDKMSRTGNEQDAVVEGLRLLAENDMKGNQRENAISLIDRELPRLRARAGRGPASVNQARRELGAGAAPKEGQPDVNLAKRLQDLNAQMQKHPVGSPEWRKLRDQVLDLERRVAVPSKENAEAKERNKEYRESREQQKRESVPAPVAPPTSLSQ